MRLSHTLLRFTGSAFSLAVLLSLPLDLAVGASPPLLTIGRLAQPAIIDGRISEGEWREALPLAAFVRPGGALSGAAPTCRVAYDVKGLVLAWQCPGAPVAGRRGHDGAPLQDEAVEVFVMPPGSSAYYQFVGSASGDTYEGMGGDDSWDAHWPFVPAVSADSWQAEMRIPFRALGRSAPAEGETWRVNFCRRGRSPVPEMSSWAPVAESFHEPDSFGYLCFSEAPACSVMSSLSLSAHQRVIVQPLLRPGGSLQATLLAGEEQITTQTTADERPIEIALPRPGTFTLRIAGIDASQELVFQQEVALVRKPPLSLTVDKRLLTQGDVQVEMDCSGLPQTPDAYRVTVGDAAPMQIAAPPATPKHASVSLDASLIQVGDEVTLVAAALQGDAVLAQVQETLVVPHTPEWLNSEVGKSEDLPEPWTPVQVEGNTITCWGREYRFHQSPLPTEIVTGGKQILASRIRLLATVGGMKQNWILRRLRFLDKSDTAVTCLATARAEQAEMRAVITTEFDGMMKIELKVAPKHSLTLDEVVLEIPLDAVHAKYLHGWGAASDGWVSGVLPTEGWKHAFVPFVWVGDEERGLQWFCESDEGWRPARPDRALVISRNRGSVVLRVNMLEKRLRPGLAFRTTFGLQATPVKPIPPEHRGWHVTHAASYLAQGKADIKLLDHMKSEGVNTLVLPQQWTEIQGYGFTNLHKDQLRDLVKACHERGIKPLLYLGNELSDAAPEWDLYRHEILLQPRRGGCRCEDVPQNAYCCCYRSPWSEYLLDSIAQMIDEYDIDGVYLDGVTEPFGCSNELHGCGYLGDDGQPRKTYPIFAVRDMMRRMRNIIKMRKPDALISAQVSAGVTIPTLAFVDVYSNGRHLDVQERGVRLVLDAFLAEFMGSNYGVPAEFLSCEDGGVSFEEALGVALVHDVLVGPSVHDDKLETMSKVWRAWDDFGVNSARWIPHWKEVGPVTSDDADALISSYVKRGGALSVITNAGERSRHFELHIDADALGLDSDRLAVSDALTEEALEVRRGLVRVKLDPLHMIMLRVREAAQEAR